MSAVDPAALDAELRERIAASVARREARRQQRAEFAARRTAGLRQRHAAKLARNHVNGAPVPAPASVPRVARTPVRIREKVAVPTPNHPEPSPDSPVLDAPPRRGGRECGYEGRDRLLAANRALGAALTKLARDSNPLSRQAGADIAAAVAELVGQAVFLAGESSGRSQQAAAVVRRELPRLHARLDALKTQLKDRGLSLTPSGDVRNQ